MTLRKVFVRRLLTFFLLLPLIQLAVSAQTPVAANGKLQVIGTHLVNQNGTPVQLRGMSTHGLNWFTEDYNFASINVLANNWGIDVLRLAMYPTEQPDQTKGGYEGNPAFWKKYIDNLVDLCDHFGIYCIIDWHVLTPGNPEDPTYFPMAKDFWDYMSKTHAGQDNVLYEICNEPNGVDWATVKDYADQIIPIIRANDPNTVIIVGSPTWSSDVDIASQDPITGYNNIMYSFHFYAGSHGQSYRDKITTAMSNGLAIFVTEWGTTDASGSGTVDITDSQTWLDFMQTNQISWCNWSYSDKNETSAALVPYTVADNGWDNLSTSGTFVKNAIQNPADSWPSSGNKPPAASITSPLDGAYFLSGSTVTITADAVDPDGTVSSVHFYANGVSIGTDNSAPYSINWTPSSTGDYQLTAVATDNSSATGTSLTNTAHIVTQINQTAYPDGTPWPIPGSINTWDFDNGGEMVAYHDVDAVHKGPAGSLRENEGVDVEGSSDVGYILSGEWLEYTVNIATDGNYQFTINVASGYPITGQLHLEEDGVAVSPVTDIPSTGDWGSYQPVTIPNVQLTGGTHVLRLAFDKGYFNTSTMSFAAVTIPPTVTLTAPSSGLSVAQGTPITLSANAADSDGSISKVEFDVGTSVVATVTSAPYTTTWTPQLSGSYSITAVAYDNMLSSTTSNAANITVTSDLQPPTTPNLALNQPATASSLETSSYPASNAVDGNTGTRWSSAFSDPQWLQVDLQSTQTINRVILNWEAAYATTYDIQVSSDATTWTTVASIVGGNGGIDDIVFGDVSARYVRMYGTERSTPYGYSLYEFEVYGPQGGNPVPVTGVTVAPTSLPLNTGGTGTLTATVSPSNATNQTVSWSTSDATVATVSSGGVVTAQGNGTATITVTTADGGFTATSTVTVTTLVVPVTGVSVTPTSLPLNVGGTGTVTANVSPSNATNKNVSWSTSDATVATVSTSGVVTAQGIGTATITAITADGGFTASCSVDVSTNNVPVTGVSVTPTTLPLNVGGTGTVTATVSPSNATNKNVNWSTSDATVATVNTSGVVTAQGNGNATITATTADGGFTASCAVTVTTPVVHVTGVTVAPTSASVAVGGTTTLTATVSPSNATDKTVSWSTSDATIATVSTSGIVTGVAPGTVTITATTTDGGFTATSAITVTTGNPLPCNNPVSITLPFTKDGSGDNCYVTSGTISYVNSWNMQTVEINGVDFTNVWSNSMPARINGNYYIHYVANVGWAHLEVNGTGGSGNVPVTGVTVSPTSASVNVGATTSLTATVSPSNATDNTVSWSSSNTNIATVNSSGVVSGVAQGNATITVTTTDGGFTASSAVTVNPVNNNVPVTGVTVAPTSATVAVNGTTTLTATVSPSNATDKSVSWSSSNTTIATVNSGGVVTGIAQGSATITVTTTDGGFTASSAITVNGGNPVPCNNPVTITIPFSQDGVGDFCWVTSQSIAYINSWNMDLLEVNGTDFTNVYASNLPAPINGNYYIHYVGSVAWAHFEAPATKNAETFTGNMNHDVKIYPVPFKNEFYIDLNGLKNVSRIELFNTMGQVIKILNGSEITSQVIKIHVDQPDNLFILKITGENGVITKTIIKK